MNPQLAYSDFSLGFDRDSTGALRVRVLDSTYGTPTAALQLPWPLDEIPRILRRLEASLEQTPSTGGRPFRPTSPSEGPLDLALLANQLTESLFHGPIRDAFLMSFSRAVALPGQALRVRIVEEPAEFELRSISALPWELLEHPQAGGFLLHDERVSIVRSLGLGSRRPLLNRQEPLSVLVALAEGADASTLQMAEELGDLLSVAAKHQRLSFRLLRRTSLETLRQAMQDSHCDVLHLVAHGDVDCKRSGGVLLLEDDRGCSFAAEASGIAALLRPPRGPSLVVLNTCRSAQALDLEANEVVRSTAFKLLDAGVPLVVAMQFSISNSAALSFARGFYDELAKSATVEAAAYQGRMAVLAHCPASWEWLTPSLAERCAVLPPDQEDREMGSSGPKHTFLNQGGVTIIGDQNRVRDVHFHESSNAVPAELKGAILHQYEQQLADIPAPLQTVVGLGLRALESRDYARAREHFQDSQKRGADSASLFLLLALSKASGARPSSLSLRAVQEVERDLLEAIRRDPVNTTYPSLLAAIKIDYYLPSGLRVPPPSIESLLASATRTEAKEKKSADWLAQHIRLSESARRISKLC